MAWFRMWDDMLDSRKHNMLPASVGWAWVQFMACANRHDYRGGTLPPMEDLTFWLRKTEQQIEDMLVECINLGLIEQAVGVFTVHNWHHWQRPADPTAATRKAKQRATEKAKPGHKRDAHRDTKRDIHRDMPRDANRDSHGHVTGEEEKLKKYSAEKTEQTPPSGGGGGVAVETSGSPKVRIKIPDSWAMAGAEGPIAALADLYAPEWVQAAVNQAATKDVRSNPAGLVGGILRRYAAQGGPDAPPTLRISPGTPAEELSRLEAEADARREKRAAMIEAQLAEQARRKAGVA